MAANTAASQESRQAMMIGIFTTFFILPGIAVGLRIWSRRLTRLSLWWDDWLVLVAMIFTAANYVSLMTGIHYGAGKHVKTITDPTHLQVFLITIYCNELIYASVVTCIKASILCLYLRIFGIDKTFAKMVYALLVLVVCWGIATLFSSVFQCRPVKAAWLPFLAGARCFSIRAWLIGTNVPNIVIDFFILVLPIPLVWGLNLSVPRRASLNAVFLVGLCTIVCSIVRVKVNSIINITDRTWNYVDTMIWSTIEGDIGVICACLPVLAPVVRYFTGRLNVTSSHEAHSKRAFQRSRPLELEDLSNFDRLEEDTAKMLPIRKTVHVQTVVASEGVNVIKSDARRPGDG